MKDLNYILKIMAESIVYTVSKLDPSDGEEYDEGMRHLFAAMKVAADRLYPEISTKDDADWWKEA